jgi:hypothetical protein
MASRTVQPPRRKPRQDRARETVEAIVEAAARTITMLERYLTA